MYESTVEFSTMAFPANQLQGFANIKSSIIIIINRNRSRQVVVDLDRLPLKLTHRIDRKTMISFSSLSSSRSKGNHCELVKQYFMERGGGSIEITFTVTLTIQNINFRNPTRQYTEYIYSKRLLWSSLQI